MFVVGEGNHFENARAWVLIEPGESIKMTDGQVLTLIKKNPKSGVCEDANGNRETIPLKKLLPWGSDAYVKDVVRQLQNELPQQEEFSASFLDEEAKPQYGCEETTLMARRIIRACATSTNPKADVLEYLKTGITKADHDMSAELKQQAARIAILHLLGDYPCPMNHVDEYAQAEWLAFSTWFYRHNKTKLLIDAAEKFDAVLKCQLGKKAFGTIFKRGMARTATAKACELKDCLHSWFERQNGRSLVDMDEAYEHLMSRIDSQIDRMTFILMNKGIFSPEMAPQALTDLLLDSPALDLLESLLVNVHGIEFGSQFERSVPTFSDIINGRADIASVIEARRLCEEAKIDSRNESAREAVAEIINIANILEELPSNHLPYINRRLRESGCKKITKDWNSQYKYHHLRFQCAGRYLSVPVCDIEIAPLVAKQYIIALADLVNVPNLTHDMLDTAINQAEAKAKGFLESLEENEQLNAAA